MAEGATFLFDDRTIHARPGQSVAAALIEAGERGFRTTPKGAERSLFCGMGVCQDCLVEVDGIPNRRACMESPREGMVVKRQCALPSLSAGAEPGEATVLSPDVLVIGCGIGGLHGAIAAAEAGASVVLVDERSVKGGQYYKQAAAAEPLDTQQREGRDLIARAERAGVVLRGGVEVWGAFEGPLLIASERGNALILKPATTIVATGAYERPCLVPGWETDGVMTTGAAQTLWRSYRTLPGQRILVTGSGPLNAQVAMELARAGAEVTLAEAAPSPMGRLGDARRMSLADPALALKGAMMLASLTARRVPIHYATALQSVRKEGRGLTATLDKAGTPLAVAADTVLMNAGFYPSNEILRLLGCAMDWAAATTDLRPKRTDDCETTVPGVFAVGDCCGLGGAPAAAAEGIIAGTAAARRLGHTPPTPNRARKDLLKARRFQAALWTLYAPASTTPPLSEDTLLCRCEEVRVGDLNAALSEGAGDIGAAKRATRIGMGRCQGRYCGPNLAIMMAERRGVEMDERAFFAPRPPVKPVSIAAILAAESALQEIAPAPAAPLSPAASHPPAASASPVASASPGASASAAANPFVDATD
ncbi:MAG: FAD-dependent oxidoreductase [Pseudomonadota bacterium]